MRTRPIIFNLKKSEDKAVFLDHKKRGDFKTIVDEYQSQLKEFNEITKLTNPSKKVEKNTDNLEEEGRWVYYPWMATVVHILEEEKFHKVITNRNRDLITEDEQEKFYNTHVAICGLSVGNSIALALALEGGCKYMTLADKDSIELSNLNRIRGGIHELGLNKAEMTARQIYSLNPYAKICVIKDGVNENNIKDFLDDVKILIDEVDDIAIKYLLRVEAQKRKIPVIMAADNSENAIIDIERYDIDNKTEPFAGRLGKVTYGDLSSLNKFETGRLIVKMLDPENIDKRMFDSFMQIGKKLVSWPQIAGATMLNGAAVAYCVRKIIFDENTLPKRVKISLDELFSQNKKDGNITEQIKKILDL